MKLYIRHDKSAGNSVFTVFDELGYEKYTVTRVKSSYYIYDNDGAVTAKIRQLPLPAIRAFSITAGNRSCRFIINSSPAANNAYFYGVSWHIRGNIFLKSFDIIDADNSVIATQCERFSPSRGYELNVYEEYNELLCLSAAVCVDSEVRSESKLVQTV